MAKLLWKSLLVSPAVLGAALLVSSSAIAASEPATAEAIQPQTAQIKLPEMSQSVALSTAPETTTIATPEFSTKVENLETAQQEVAPVQVETSKQLAAAPSQTETKNSAAALGVDTSNNASIPVMTPTDAKLAQTPASNTVDNNTVLEQINRYSREGNNSQSQVTNVSQLSDVQPTDWAYEALRSLVERYGCIAGYPDGTYRGNRAMSRYEFAAGLNACLQQIEKLIASSTSEFVTKEDLATLQRLIDEFGAELATLRTRVDNLEGRVTFLEGHQFSTTTKLVGEAIFAVTDEFSNRSNTNTVFVDRVRLDLQTSFTGKDILHTRLAAGNATPFQPSGTLEGNQTFDLNPGGNNDVFVDWLAYEFPFGSSKVYIAATGGLHADYAPVLNPYFYDGDGGNGALSTFAQQSPIYRIGGGAGAAIRLGVGRAPILGPTSLSVGYLADNLSANNPGTDNGLFNGDYSALAQLNFTVSDRLALAATYVHGYHDAGNGIFDLGGSPRTGNSFAAVGTAAANDITLATPTGSQFALLKDNAFITNSYGLEAALRLSDRFSISGFVGKTDIAVTESSGRGDVWYYGLGVAFPDLGKRGNVLGLFAGVEPYLAGLEVQGDPVGIQSDRSYHIEGFYKYQLTDNISVTPGVIWITAPNQNDDNNDAVIGTLRTTFTF